MSYASKITVRQRKITRKRVFAEFVASHLESSAECKNKSRKHHIQAVSSTATVPQRLVKPDGKRFTKRTRYNESQDCTSECGGQVEASWSCCGLNFSEPLAIHKHVAKEHQCEIERLTETRLCKIQQPELDGVECVEGIQAGTSSDEKQRRLITTTSETNPYSQNQSHESDKSTKNTSRVYRNTDVFPWLPSEEDCSQVCDDDEGEILLYYKYVDVKDPHDVCEWHKELCRRLGLTGKIRIASEGINGTVGGRKTATQLYMKAVQHHPLFQQIDFKTSNGSENDFPKGLQVGVHSEIVPMGVSSAALSYRQAGSHIEVEEFHKELETHLSKNEDDTVFVDCRNFYESRIGQFPGALAPDIRKFSYWPEYIDQNIQRFKDKRVIMYCTGGIRCERGSAYLKSKGMCKDVLQLKGGIHRYMEKYPNGFFNGKLFVFDDRYSIASNDSVISNCFYCNKPWDKYEPCTSPHCHQLVLSCLQCRGQGSTTCCQSCKQITEKAQVKGQKVKEECECTRGRVRIPNEEAMSSKDASNVSQDNSIDSRPDASHFGTGKTIDSRPDASNVCQDKTQPEVHEPTV